jgi:2,4-dienoyl-CoA reductase-like NADH-dependent reductase (Old Yellow Enzyme family)
MIANQKSFVMKMGLALFGRFIVQNYKYTPLFHLKEAIKIKEAVRIPVIYIGGIKTPENLFEILDHGFEFVQIGRALIHNPELTNDIMNNKTQDKYCDICNRCVAAMDGGGVYCVSKEQGYKL